MSEEPQPREHRDAELPILAGASSAFAGRESREAAAVPPREGSRPRPGAADQVAAESGARNLDEAVREAIVRAVPRLQPPPIALLIPIAVTPGWSAAQQAALKALTDVLADWEMPEADLDMLLGGLASTDPLPWGPEQAWFAALARAIGFGRLAERLRGPNRMRAGAALLLLAYGEPFALRLVAALNADPASEIRVLARVASRLVGQASHEEAREAETAVPPPPAGAGDAFRDEAEGSQPEGQQQPPESGHPEEPPLDSVEDVPALGHDGREQLKPATRVAPTFSVPEPLGAQRADPQSLLDAASAPGGLERDANERALAAQGLTGDRLVRLAAAVDPTHRAEAVRVIRRVGGRSILAFLPELASDSAGAVRTAVVEAVAEAGGPGGMELARRLLRDDSSAAVRAAAVRALARAEGAVAVDALTRALLDPDPDVRAVAVAVLPPGHPQAIDLLARALGDEDPGVWQAALRGLAALGDRGLPLLWSAILATPAERRDELLAAIERGDPADLAALALGHAGAPDPVERAVAVEMAARAATPECTSVVIEALQDPDHVVRQTAARGLSEMRTTRAVPALAARLRDPQVGVRIESLRALAAIDDKGVPPALVSALKDPDALVRDMAADAIMAWRSATMARRLVEALAAPSLRRQAAELLERMGPSVVEPLVAVVTGDDVETAGAAARVLERTVGAERFVADLSSPNVTDRLRAVTVIGALGDEAALQALPSALADPTVTIRARAASLLGAIGDHRALPHLESTARSDPAPEVASAARAAMERIEGRAAPPGEVDARDDVQNGDDEPAGEGPHLRRV